MDETTPETLWNSLEIVKLLVSALTPLLVITVGFWVNRRLKRIEQLQWANQKIIEKRIDVFDKLAPLLNDLLVFFTYRGRWREFTPPDIVRLKRELDRTFHVYAPLFSDDLKQSYNYFMDLCYKTFSGWGQDAKLRTHTQRRKDAAGDSWNLEWDGYFVEEGEVYDPQVLVAAYQKLMSDFAAELGIGLNTANIHVGGIPSNIR